MIPEIVSANSLFISLLLLCSILSAYSSEISLTRGESNLFSMSDSICKCLLNDFVNSLMDNERYSKQ